MTRVTITVQPEHAPFLKAQALYAAQVAIPLERQSALEGLDDIERIRGELDRLEERLRQLGPEDEVPAAPTTYSDDENYLCAIAASLIELDADGASQHCTHPAVARADLREAEAGAAILDQLPEHEEKTR